MISRRAECSPRKIKRIKTEAENSDNDNGDSQCSEDLVYNFYRFIIHPMILRLKSQKEKLNYSQWLTKLDTCDDDDYKIPLIKMLFISLKNNRTLRLYAEPPVDDLSELNLDLGSPTTDMLKNAQESTNEYYIIENENLPQETKHKRSAAVATDMCSYITTKTSHYLVQSFYSRSDFPIQTWYNPAFITVPNNIDHNQWELYLNRFDLLSNEICVDEEVHANTCESIMNLDQVQKELNSACIFRWHPHSILHNVDRPKRSAGYLDIDQDITTQPIYQQQIDESAFNIVHQKTFPGYKMLNPRIYSTVLMPSPDFVFNMTGVRITYNNISHISSILKESKTDILEECKLKYDNLPTRICSVDCDGTKSIWSKPNKSNDIKTTKIKNNNQKLLISLNPTKCQQNNVVITENNCKSNDPNGYDGKSFANSKCENKSLGSGCKLESIITCEPRILSKKPNLCHTVIQSENCVNNLSNVKNIQLGVSNSGKSPKNEILNCGCTISTNKISSVKNSETIYSYTFKSTSIKADYKNAQYSNQCSRQCNSEIYKDQQSSKNLVKLQKDECKNEKINQSIRRNNSTIQLKSRQRSISVPCDYNRKNQNASKSKQCHTYQNDPYSKRKHNNTSNESIKKSCLSIMNKCSNRNEKIYIPRYKENSDTVIDDYSKFEINNYGNGGDSSHYEGNNHSIEREKSLNNFPVNQNILYSDENCNSSWSTETSWIDESSRPTYCNSSNSLTTLTSDLSSTEMYPSLGFDSSSSTKSPKMCSNLNSSTDYRNNGNQINREYSFTEDVSGSFHNNNYTNKKMKCGFDNVQKGRSNVNKSWSEQEEEYHNISIPNTNNDWEINYVLTDNNIENTSFPQMSYVDSCSSITSFINESQDLENIIVQNLSYTTSCSEDDTSVDNYTDF